MNRFRNIFKAQPIGTIEHLFCGMKDGRICVYVDTVEVDASVLKYNVDQIEQAIIDVLGQFPVVDTDSYEKFVNARNGVARQSRRGVANHGYQYSYWYQSAGGMIDPSKLHVDSPLVVVTDGVMYGIVKHPSFDKMGFVATHMYDATDPFVGCESVFDIGSIVVYKGGSSIQREGISMIN